MPQPLNSRDIVLSDYYSFHVLQNYLNGKNMDSADEIRTTITEYVLARTSEFGREVLHIYEIVERELGKMKGSMF